MYPEITELEPHQKLCLCLNVKDCKGKEIWEGDFVQCGDEVKIVESLDGDLTEWAPFCFDHGVLPFEVIGNIFEDWELYSKLNSPLKQK